MLYPIRVISIFTFSLLVILASSKLFSIDYFIFQNWADRDLYRGFEISNLFQVYGAELNLSEGGRNFEKSTAVICAAP